MFTREQLLNAYVEYIRKQREHPELFITQEEADATPVEDEAKGATEYLIAIMEGRDPFKEN